MAGTRLVHSEIDRFLISRSAEVLCLTGRWGVGKTYTWKRFVEAAQAGDRVALKRYAYVSLFGQNSLQDLKSAIFEETVDVGQIDKGFDLKSIPALVSKGKTYGPWLFNHARKLVPWLKDAPDIAERWLFLTVRHQIVCFDDLERVGRGLDLKDVFGLMSFLKEERGCKIVVLLNEGGLGERTDEYRLLLEKVVDVRLEFDPTSEEAVAIGLNADSAIRDYLAENCIALDIVNIRVIRKIERLAQKLSNLLEGYDEKVLKQAIHSVTLLGWVVFQPKDAPALDFISGLDSFSQILREKEEPSDQEKAWRALLRKYKFGSLDEFDKVILEGVQSGAFDPEKLKTVAEAADAQAKFQRQDNSFSEAWDLFHRSLTIPADVVLDRLASAFKSSVATITPTNLSGTISLFKDLGRSEQAKELLQFYLESRASEGPKFFDLQENIFGGHVKDPDVRAAFDQRSSVGKVRRDPKLLLLNVARNKSWGSSDLEELAGVSADGFKSLFKATEGDELSSIISAALEFGRIGNASDDMKTIASNATAALRSIAAESAINARRLALYGISPDIQQ